MGVPARPVAAPLALTAVMVGCRRKATEGATRMASAQGRLARAAVVRAPLAATFRQSLAPRAMAARELTRGQAVSVVVAVAALDRFLETHLVKQVTAAALAGPSDQLEAPGRDPALGEVVEGRIGQKVALVLMAS